MKQIKPSEKLITLDSFLKQIHGQRIRENVELLYKSISKQYLDITHHSRYITTEVQKKNQNSPRPSEHPPVRGKKMSNLPLKYIVCFEPSARNDQLGKRIAFNAVVQLDEPAVPAPQV